MNIRPTVSYAGSTLAQADPIRCLRAALSVSAIPILSIALLMFSVFFASSLAEDELVPDSNGAVEVSPLHAPADFNFPVSMNSHALTRADYPIASIAQCESGDPRLRYVVLEDGTVGDVQVVRSSGFPRLDDASILVVKRWRFKPALYRAKPVAAWITVETSWQLGKCVKSK